jgi:hypothetical protein
MPMPSKLPEDSALLRDHFIDGLSFGEIGEKYGVNKSNVSRRFAAMNRPHGGNAALDYSQYLPWQIGRAYLSDAPALMLYAHIRNRVSLTMPDVKVRLLETNREIRLKGWWTTLRQGRILVAVEAESPPGLRLEYVPRTSADGRLVIRWPNDAQPMTDDQRAVLSLPEDMTIHIPEALH